MTGDAAAPVMQLRSLDHTRIATMSEHGDEYGAESEETGAGTGDLRENEPDDPGFTPEGDRLFRSHFQHANRLADRAYEHVRGAYQLGYIVARDPARAEEVFEDVEHDLEQGWLNVRTSAGDWAAVRDFAREGFEQGRALGFIDVAASGDETPTYSDPLAGGIDPTSPESPEQQG